MLQFRFPSVLWPFFSFSDLLYSVWNSVIVQLHTVCKALYNCSPSWSPSISFFETVWLYSWTLCKALYNCLPSAGTVSLKHLTLDTTLNTTLDTQSESLDFSVCRISRTQYSCNRFCLICVQFLCGRIFRISCTGTVYRRMRNLSHCAERTEKWQGVTDHSHSLTHFSCPWIGFLTKQ